MTEEKKGQITIIAKNIKGKAKGQILEESKNTKNFAGEKFYQHGKKGGVNNGKNKERKASLELRVLKVDGPFDENNKNVEVIEKNKWHTYKVAQFNREPKKEELQNLRWGVKYDDGKVVELKDVSCKGFKEISHKVLENNNSSKLRIYAFFKAPNENASVEVFTEHLRLVVTNEVIGYSIIRLFDVSNKGIGTTNPACIVRVYKAKLVLIQKNVLKELYSFGVTRDGWQKIDEIDKDTYYLINRAFEPKDADDNIYDAIDYKYPNQIKGWIQFPAYKLSKKNNLKLPAEPIERNTKLDGKTPIGEARDDINFAKDVMIHIGGHYRRGGNIIVPRAGGLPIIVKVGPDWLGGSLGCFGFVESVDIKSSIELAIKAHNNDDYDDTMSDDEWYKAINTIKKYRDQYKLKLLIQIIKRNDVKKITTFKKQDILWE